MLNLTTFFKIAVIALWPFLAILLTKNISFFKKKTYAYISLMVVPCIIMAAFFFS